MNLTDFINLCRSAATGAMSIDDFAKAMIIFATDADDADIKTVASWITTCAPTEDEEPLGPAEGDDTECAEADGDIEDDQSVEADNESA